MQNNNNEREAYLIAEKKVKDIKGFYFNLLIYFISNAALIYVNLVYSPHFHWFWYSVLIWGLGMLIYGMIVYRCLPFMNKNWEKRKLEELLENGNGNQKETSNTEIPLNTKIQYDLAKKRVRTLKNLYRHIVAYILVIIISAALVWEGFKTENNFFTYAAYGTACGWTIGLIIHVFKVFGTSVVMGKDWENRKLRELIEKEK